MKTRGVKIPTGVVLLTLAWPAFAEIEPVESISGAAVAHVREHLVTPPSSGQVEYRVSSGRLDPRLRMRRCDTPLETFLPSGTRVHGNTTVGVRCADEPGWTLYVPVSVEGLAEVVVLRRALPRGAKPGPNDVALETREVRRLNRGWFGALDELAGHELRRQLSAGAVLSPNDLTAPRVVQRDEPVTLRSVISGIEVRGSGRALTDAALGERVAVRNERSGKVVEGVVAGPGLVDVGH